MSIPTEIAGAYLGYTLGREKPTLYFENGRYTQVYPNDLNNVGWHPNGLHYRGANITKLAHDTIMDIPVGDTVKENQFVNDFLAKKFDSDAPDALFFECYSKEGKWSLHPSSSRLIKKDDKSFDATYGDSYAADVLKSGVLAPNEK